MTPAEQAREEATELLGYAPVKARDYAAAWILATATAGACWEARQRIRGRTAEQCLDVRDRLRAAKEAAPI